MAPSTPLILAVETATPVTSVALLRGEVLVAEKTAAAGVDASVTLLAMLDELFEGDPSRLDAVDAFAVSIGPGSFTGLRIGVATLKGLAFGRPHRAVAVSPLEALAAAAQTFDRPGVPVIAARRGVREKRTDLDDARAGRCLPARRAGPANSGALHAGG